MKTVVNLLSSSIFIYASIKYMDYLLPYRAKHKRNIWLTALFFLCLTTAFYIFELGSILYSMSFLAMMLSFSLFFSNWKRIAVVTSFLIVALFISEVMTFYVIELLDYPLLKGLPEEQLMLIGSTVSKFMIPLILYIFAKMFKFAFSKETIPSKYLVGCLSIPFLSIFIFHYIVISSRGIAPRSYSVAATPNCPAVAGLSCP